MMGDAVMGEATSENSVCVRVDLRNDFLRPDLQVATTSEEKE